jgi:hypothetical protein
MDWSDGILAGLMTLLAATSIALVVIIVVLIGDHVGADVRYGDAVVTQLKDVPAHMSIIPAGKVMIPVHHPRHWEACVQVGAGNDCVNITQKDYNATVVGEHVSATYIVGSWTGSLYVSSIQRHS